MMRWKRYNGGRLPTSKWDGWCVHVTLPIKRYFRVDDGRLVCREIEYKTQEFKPFNYTKEEDQDWGTIDVSKSVKEALKPFSLVLPGVLYEAARIAVKKARCPMAKDWEEVVPKKVAAWAWGIIHQEIDDPCVDNVRVALCGKATQVRRYRKQQKQGCCGSFDVVLDAPDGKRYMVGCNYGH